MTVKIINDIVRRFTPVTAHLFTFGVVFGVVLFHCPFEAILSMEKYTTVGK